MTVLKETFIRLLKNYTDNECLPNELWTEIEKNYSGKKRHYHTLHHLDNLLTQLTEIKGEIQNWDTILFTLYYHDIIYNSLKSDNEEKSAELAEKRMTQISVPVGIVEHCKKQILATKSHIKSTDSDTNYFTDADLSILRQPWDTYSFYYKNVRKEYSIYPDLVYNPGRKKVLNNFLKIDRIFKTDLFTTNSKFKQKKMFRKNYTDFEMTERINIFWMELDRQCNEHNCSEFEYYWEMWGVWWMPWFIEVNSKSLNFSANDISDNDLNLLVEKGKIEIIKIYDKLEMNDEFDRIRYRIIKNHS